MRVLVPALEIFELPMTLISEFSKSESMIREYMISDNPRQNLGYDSRIIALLEHSFLACRCIDALCLTCM